MKLFGFLLVTVGFIMAALAAVVDQSAVRAADESAVEVVDESVVEAAEDSTVKWAWYIPALAVGVAGVVIIRMTEARQTKTEHHVAANIETIETSLAKIAANIEKLNAEKHSIDTYDMRHRIDDLFAEDLEMFVDARESIAHRYGLNAYGEIMTSFAAGERYLNRVWSASADGYIDEVNEYLEKAKDQFAESLAIIRRLQRSPQVA
ncbi:MAG: hypothetical protein ACYTAS_11195 [Planctomycetota bacterium]|jgi:hypothetical protein